MQNLRNEIVFPLSDQRHVHSAPYLALTETQKEAAIAGHAEVTIKTLLRKKHSSDPRDNAEYTAMETAWEIDEGKLWDAQRVRAMGLAPAMDFVDWGAGLIGLAAVIVGGAVLIGAVIHWGPAIAHAFAGIGWGK